MNNWQYLNNIQVIIKYKYTHAPTHNILKQKYTGNYRIQGHTCTHTHPERKCDTVTQQRTKRRFGLWAPLQRNHFQVFLLQNCFVSCNRNWKEVWKAADDSFFLVSAFYCLNISSQELKILKMRIVSTTVIVLFSCFIAVYFCEMATNRLFYTPAYTWWYVRVHTRFNTA